MYAERIIIVILRFIFIIIYTIKEGDKKIKGSYNPVTEISRRSDMHLRLYSYEVTRGDKCREITAHDLNGLGLYYV